MSEDRLDYAVLISLATREEGEVAAAALRADGVDAFLGNSNHSAVEWFYVHALGGIQILVPRRKLAEAKQLLRERIQENASVVLDEPMHRRDRWKIWILIVYVVVPSALSLALWFVGILGNWWDGTGWLGPGVERPEGIENPFGGGPRN